MQYARFRQHKILTTIGIAVTALLLTVIGIIVFSEPLARWLIATQGEKQSGRELKIDGDFNINWSWNNTAVHAEKIRLANAPDYPDQNMMTLETLNFTFKPLKLLTGKLEFGEIKLDQLYLVLDRKSEDEANWHFPAFVKKDDDEDPIVEDRHEIPLISQLLLKDGNIIYRDAVRGLDFDLALDSLIGEGSEEDGDINSNRGFSINGTGSMREQNFELEATGASLEALRDTSQPYPLYLKLVMGDTEVTVDGTFQDPIKLTGIDALLKISGSNMADLYYITDIPLPPTTPYTFEGQLRKESDVWSSNDFSVSVGDSDLSGDLSFDTGGERGFLQASLLSNVLDSRDLGGIIGLVPSEEKDLAEEKEPDPAAKIIPNVPLALERLRASDLDVTLKAETINAPNLPFKGMEVRFNLRDGHLVLDPLNVVLADGTIDGIIDINGQHDVPPMKINLNLKNLSLDRFFDGTRFAAATSGVFGGAMVLEGTGASLADVLASSNGEMTIIMSGGTISKLLIEATELDIARIIPLFFGDDESTRIRCGVIDFDVADGKLTSDLFIFDTQKSTLVGDINIDMKDELIDAVLLGEPKDGSPLSAQTPLIVSGTLSTISVGFDAERALKRGAAAAVLGALLSPFAAILAFVDTGGGEDANCSALMNEAKNSAGTP